MVPLSKYNTITVLLSEALTCLVINTPLKTYKHTINVFSRLSRSRDDDVTWIEEPSPIMVLEDFAFYTKKVSSLFIFIGTRNEEKSLVFPIHHPRFNMDGDVLWLESAIYSIVAYKYLEKNFVKS